jgi:hypothetical protein
MKNPTLKLWQPDDYPILSSWWAGHSWTPVPQIILPKCGVIAGDKAAAWLYMDCSTPVSILEWMVTDPEAKPREAYVALKTCVNFLQEEAKIYGKPFMLSTCRQESLARFLEKQGFTRTDSEMVHFCKILEVANGIC